MNEKTPTIRSLAKLAGVSSATVSLALRNHPRIRLKVRKRIQKIANEVGYKPNPVVANLIAQVRANKTTPCQSTLGVILTYENPADLEVTAVREWIAGCEAGAARSGHGCDRFVPCQEDIPPERLAKIIDARGIRGLIAIGRFPDGVIPSKFDLIWRQCATIAIGCRPIRPALSCVTDDQFSNTLLAMREVKRLGYRRPGLCIHADVDDLVEHRFLGGFLTEQSLLPQKDRIEPFSYEPDSEITFRHWIKRNRPDVILTLHSEVRGWLEALELNTPNDIGLVHLDRTAELDEWAGIQQFHKPIGTAAVDMLIGQLHRNEFGPPSVQKCVQIYGNWLDGKTVKKQRRASEGRSRV